MLKKMIPAVLLAIVSFALLGLGGGGQDGVGAAYVKLSAPQARAVMDSGESYVLLDVRTDEEFQARHIGGALLIPHTEVATRAASELPNKDIPVLVYCRSGRRSAMAAKELVRMGYTKVYDMGGINDWPHETVTGAGSAKQ